MNNRDMKMLGLLVLLIAAAFFLLALCGCVRPFAEDLPLLR